MTYTGRPRISFAHELPAAVHPSIDIWIRTATGDRVTVQAAERNGDIITITATECNWPRPDTTITIALPATARINTKVY